ncbi:serine/threonine-protein kinase, partial [Neoroseomonas rubea]|uniref:serine/threonine-protein kinase n=1 Tax=Neoroseomonas rubea TaxID=2748666 RepID=UPI0018DF8E50
MSQAAPHLHDDDPTLASLAPAADGTPALIAGRYEVRDSIGRGAFGEVFEAYDRVLGRLVAVKVMPIAQNLGAEGRESLRRFQVEARAVSRLTHPNIITVHDFGQGERFAWIVMELVIGETLADALRRTGPPPLAETSRILCALLSALHAAHERGIVHRDVKPGNILLEMNLEDGLGEVRLSDFGIARTEADDRTVVGQMIGTPWVMAPEQLRGEAVDRRTDLWAAGVILYDMLTGERPFKGTMPGIFHRIQHEEPPAPTRLRAELPPAVDGLVARALAKAPEDRFATAEEMAAAIRAALTEAPRWQDAPPLPGLDLEPPVGGALVPAMPPALLAPPVPARGRFGQGIAVGMVAGLALGIAATRVADMAAVVAVDVAPPVAGASAASSSVVEAPVVRGDAASVAAAPSAGDVAARAPALAWMPEPAEAIRSSPGAGAASDTTPPALRSHADEAHAAAGAPPRQPTVLSATAEAGIGVASSMAPVARPAQAMSDVLSHDGVPPGGMPPGAEAAARGADVPPDAATRDDPRVHDEAAQGGFASGVAALAPGPLPSAAAATDAQPPAQHGAAADDLSTGGAARGRGHAAFAAAAPPPQLAAQPADRKSTGLRSRHTW